MRNWRGLTLLIVPLLLAGCFFLPNTVARITDSGRLDNLIIIEAESISFDSGPELGLPERIALASNPNSESLGLKAGKVYADGEAAYEKAVSELRRFLEESAFEFEFDSCYSEGSSAAFVIDSENPTINMIMWEVIVYDRSGNSIIAVLDDETGIIVKIIYRRPAVNVHFSVTKESAVIVEPATADPPDEQGDTLYKTALELMELMTAYYGLPVRLADYKLIGGLGYYTAELSGGTSVVPMYGIVRETVFTINEKPNTK